LVVRCDLVSIRPSAGRTSQHVACLLHCRADRVSIRPSAGRTSQPRPRFRFRHNRRRQVSIRPSAGRASQPPTSVARTWQRACRLCFYSSLSGTYVATVNTFTEGSWDKFLFVPQRDVRRNRPGPEATKGSLLGVSIRPSAGRTSQQGVARPDSRHRRGFLFVPQRDVRRNLGTEYVTRVKRVQVSIRPSAGRTSQPVPSRTPPPTPSSFYSSLSGTYVATCAPKRRLPMPRPRPFLFVPQRDVRRNFL